MTMNKCLGVLAVCSAMGCLSLPVPAVNQNTHVRLLVMPEYTVVIPSDTAVPYGAGITDFGAVGLSRAVLPPEGRVRITLSPGASLKNRRNAEDDIPYRICDVSGALFREGTYCREGETTSLTIRINDDDWQAALGGAYADTVQFDVTYETAGRR